MFRQLWKQGRKQDGFTLIELIVVVAILGILAAVLTPRVLDAIENARANAAEASAKQIQLAMERYLIENNFYPAENTIFVTEPNGDEREIALRNALDRYASLDTETFQVDAYDGFTNVDGTGAADPAETAVRSYQLEITFLEGDVTYQITPHGLTLITD